MFVCLRGLKSRMGREGKGNGPQATWDRCDTDWRAVTSKVERKHPMDSHWIILNATDDGHARERGGASVPDKEAPANHHLRGTGTAATMSTTMLTVSQGYLRNSVSGVPCCLLIAACGSDVGRRTD